MSSAVQAWWQRVVAWPALQVDLLLYGLSTGFAGVTAFTARTNDYREWGQMAAVAYAIASVICALTWYLRRRGSLSANAVSWTRRAVVGALVLGAVLIPLSAELTWRAEAKPGAHAQAEVSVIERAGDRAAAGHDPYLARPTVAGVPPQSDQRSVDASSFFPYLPGMVPFGMINALHGPRELTDARVTLAGFSLMLAALVLLASSSATLARRGRVLQFLVVLPSGALPIVTGGDDLPVLALLLVGVMLADRRHPVWSGIALGFASTLKLTAWPIAVLLILVVRHRDGRRARFSYALSAAVIALPVVGLGIGLGPDAFFENVVRFPLGLAPVQSPAQSPLLGQVLVSVFPHDRRAVTLLLGLIGVLIAYAVYRRYPLRSVADVCRYAALLLILATALAPATRFGYLIYPANLLVWAYLLDSSQKRAPSAEELQSASSTSNKRSLRSLVSVGSPPASAGETD